MRNVENERSLARSVICAVAAFFAAVETTFILEALLAFFLLFELTRVGGGDDTTGLIIFWSGCLALPYFLLIGMGIGAWAYCRVSSLKLLSNNIPGLNWIDRVFVSFVSVAVTTTAWLCLYGLMKWATVSSIIAIERFNPSTVDLAAWAVVFLVIALLPALAFLGIFLGVGSGLLCCRIFASQAFASIARKT